MKIWLVGATQMAMDYVKVLDALQLDFIAIGRNKQNAQLFTEKTGHPIVSGGLQTYLECKPELPTHAIVAVGVDQLTNVTRQLLHYGVKKILIEKPGGLTLEEIQLTEKLSLELNAEVFVGYNRRFYSSALKAKEIIAEDGGVSSFHFEFTEWSHVVEKVDKPVEIKLNWFLANSTHVVDLAFFLGGKPLNMHSLTSGKLSWHQPAIFAGAGKTDSGALFSYNANWIAPGRWAIEVMTTKHRLVFKPLEQLQIQEIGSVKQDFVEIDDELDKQFKPGLYLQTRNFLTNNIVEFCTLEEQLKNLETTYLTILNIQK